MGTLKPFFSFRNLIKTFFIILFMIFQSCSKVYLGSHDQALFDEINQSESMDAAINGLLQSLDPYSSYMSPELFKEMQTDTRG